jgi:hypothetical protein
MKQYRQLLLIEQELLQRKVDTQLCLVDIFRYLSQTWVKEHMRLRKKHVSTKEAWHFALLKLDGRKQLGYIFYVQV